MKPVAALSNLSALQHGDDGPPEGVEYVALGKTQLGLQLAEPLADPVAPVTMLIGSQSRQHEAVLAALNQPLNGRHKRVVDRHLANTGRRLGLHDLEVIPMDVLAAQAAQFFAPRARVHGHRNQVRELAIISPLGRPEQRHNVGGFEG